MGSHQPVYKSEAALVADLVEHLAKTAAAVDSEFDYTRGRTDVVALQSAGELHAIEAKLTRWRDALHQAYRNKCFAHRSYVALPPATAALAVQYASEFTDRAVGILVVTKDGIEVLLEVEPAPPVQAWLTDVAVASLRASTVRCTPPTPSD
jgi:hypothetical protein